MLKHFSILSVFITLVIFTSCDSIDLYTYAKDGMYGPHFTTFSINGNAGVINTKKCTVDVYLSDTGLTGLTPVFTISGKRVVYNGSDIASGTLPIDFTSPQVFTIYGKLGNSCDFTVTVHAATGLVITPDDPSISIGQNLQLYASFTYANGHTQSASGVAWSVSSGTAATVNSTTGLITGSATGSATIAAIHSSTGFSDTVIVTVYDAPYITLSTTSMTITSGDTLSVFITCDYTALGTTTDVTSLITWTENDPGTVQFVSYTAGTLTIRGWSTTGTGSLTATYAAAGVQTDFNVSVDSRSYFCVSPGGNDSYPGSETYPLETISAAMGKAVSGNEVRVMAGTYIESVNIIDGVTLRGSYDTGFTTQDIASPSIIQSQNAGTGAVYYTSGGITGTATIDCFELIAADATESGNPVSYAVRIQNSENTGYVIIERCIITAAAGYSSNDSFGIQMSGCNSVIRNNIIIVGSSSSNGYVYGINVTGSSTTTYIFNNVINCGNCESAYRYGININNASPYIINNIIYVPYLPLSSYSSVAINEAATSSSPDVFSSNILFVGSLSPTGDYLYNDNDGAFNYIYDIGNITSVANTVTGPNYSVDPDFITTGSVLPYQLNTSSPAINNGQDVSNYVSGFSFDNDLDGGTARSSYTSWTIGPYQYPDP